MEHQTAIIRLVSFPVVCGEARRFLYASSYPIGFLGGGSETTGLPVAGAAFRPQGAPRVNRNKRRKRQRTVAPIEVAEGGNRSLGHRPASTQRRAAGFGRQFKNCTPSAALKRAALTRAVPPHIIFILALTPPRFRAGVFLRPSRRGGGASRRRGSAAAVSAPRVDRRWPGPRPGKGRRRFRRLGR